MDMRQNRPADATAPVAAPSSSRHYADSLGSKKLVAGLLAVVLVMVIIGGLFKAWNMLMADRVVKGNEYQALFLTNNQVYFGKLSQTQSGYVKMTDIYYLQVQQAVQPDANKNNAQQQQQISLAKLGSELHGPEDVMYVAKSQVLFWENLKNDGKVAQAISDYKKSQKK